MTEKKIQDTASTLEKTADEKPIDQRRKAWSQGYEGIEKFSKYAESLSVIEKPVYDLNRNSKNG